MTLISFIIMFTSVHSVQHAHSWLWLSLLNFRPQDTQHSNYNSAANGTFCKCSVYTLSTTSNTGVFTKRPWSLIITGVGGHIPNKHPKFTQYLPIIACTVFTECHIFSTKAAAHTIIFIQCSANLTWSLGKVNVEMIGKRSVFVIDATSGAGYADFFAIYLGIITN